MKRMNPKEARMMRFEGKQIKKICEREPVVYRRSLLAVLLSCVMIMAFFPVEIFAEEQDLQLTEAERFPVLQESVSTGAETKIPVCMENETEEFDGFLVRMKNELTVEELEMSGCEPVGGCLYYAETIEKAYRLSVLGEIDYCEPNSYLSIQEADDNYEPENWNLQSIEASAAWKHKNAVGKRDRLGKNVVVAVVDSGVMADHPDLQDEDILDTVVVSSEEDGLDDYHGTFITGLLAAEVNNGIGIDGMVPEITILPVCITSRGGKTDTKTAVEGIRAAVDLGAEVISFSVSGTSDNQSLHDVCEYAASKGVILVTCSGNYSSGYQKNPSNYKYPAAYDCVVTVSACKKNGEDVVFDDSYSYFNDAVTVSAPGTNIKSLYLDGDTATRTGTSFAAPMVAALAVMAKQADPSIDRDGFVSLLQDSVIDLGTPGYDVYYGYGYINVPSFLETLDERQADQSGNEGGEQDPPGENAQEGQESGSDHPGDGTPESDDPGQNDVENGENSQEGQHPDTGESENGITDSNEPEQNQSENGENPQEGQPPDMNEPGNGTMEPNNPGENDSENGKNPQGEQTPSAGEPDNGAPGIDDSDKKDEENQLQPVWYQDVPETRWSYPDIVYVTNHKLMNGIGEDRFAPSVITSRAMLVTMLWRLEGSPKYDDSLAFKDVKADTWYAGAVNWAVKENVVKGYTEDSFGPEDPVTREQVAVLLFRYHQLKNYYILQFKEVDLNAYSDAVRVSSWAREGVKWAVSTGLLRGFEDNSLEPFSGATREQIATVIRRYCERVS